MATATKAVEAADIVEDVKDLVEDTVEFVEVKASWLSNPKTHILGAALVGAVLGSALTYLVVSKRISAKVRAEAEQEIEDVKRHYSATPIVPSKPDLALLAEQTESEQTVEQIRDINGYAHYNDVDVNPPVPEGTAIVPVAEEPGVQERNVFEAEQEIEDVNWDWDAEKARREEYPDRPFVITKEEFDGNETNYDHISLTYFDGDGVLTDNLDQMVPDQDAIVGDENLMRFGHGSGDPKIVYVRNNRLEADIEVQHSEGSYAREVLGVRDESELRHSNGRPGKFRDRHDG